MSNINIMDIEHGISVDIKYQDIIDRNADKCSAILHQISPAQKKARDNRYRDGWAVRKGTMRDNQYYAEVWNETNYQLTHLLENGHLITNKRNGVGWSPAKPHIQKALDRVKPTFLTEMSRVDIDVDLK